MHLYNLQKAPKGKAKAIINKDSFAAVLHFYLQYKAATVFKSNNMLLQVWQPFEFEHLSSAATPTVWLEYKLRRVTQYNVLLF